MISTDGVKQAADDLNVIESQPIVDELNRLQSQKFIDPNCDPADPELVDVTRESFCDDPLEATGRQQRLNDFLGKLPKLPGFPNQEKCAQAAISKLTTLIQQKFSFKTLQEDMKKNKYAEELAETQLAIVLFASSLVYALGQVSKKTPVLTDQAKAQLDKAISGITAIEASDNIAVFERQYILDSLNEARNRLNNIVEDKTTFDVRIVPAITGFQSNILNVITSPLVLDQTSIFKKINKKIKYTQRKPDGKFGDAYKKASDRMIKSSSPSIDNYYTDIIDYKKAYLDSVNNSIKSAMNNGTTKAYAYYQRATADVDKSGIAQSTIKFLTDACTDLINFFNSYVNETPKTPTEKDVFSEISKIDFCGTKLPSTSPASDAPPDSDNSADLSHNTFDVGNKPTITELKYWQRYARYLTLANLLPTYWTIGLYIPTPSGIVKVPLPTVWRPLFVINAQPFGLIVIFLTINGIAISPTIWVWKFPPFGKNESNLVVMLRAFNKKIKDDTGDALLNVPVVNGININPTLTKRLPFKQDDLPTIKRMGIPSNLPFLNYLNTWLSTYKMGGGLP